MHKTCFLNKQLKIFLNYFVGPVLFVWLSFSIYRQIQKQNDLQQSWGLIQAAFSGQHFVKLLLVIGLMFVNWGIEAKKWQYLVYNIQKISFLKSLRAVFSGQALGFSTLNGIGESAGRSIFLLEGNRLRGIVISFVGSMSQIVVTYVMGILSLIYLRLYVLDSTHQLEGLSVFWVDSLIYSVTAGILVFILLYFRLSWLVQLLEKIPFIARYKFFVQKLEDLHWKELTRILIFSASRYVIYLTQYILLFQVFEVSVYWMDAAAMVGVMLLILSIVPSITLVELGFRGKLSISLFGLLSSNLIGIVAATAGIWMINIILPSITGGLFLLGIRLFRNK